MEDTLTIRHKVCAACGKPIKGLSQKERDEECPHWRKSKLYRVYGYKRHDWSGYTTEEWKQIA